MFKFLKPALLAAALLLAQPLFAGADTGIDTNLLHTLSFTHPLELKPISQPSYLVAKSYFLPDFSDPYAEFREVSANHNDGTNCENFSYNSSNCKSPYILKNRCPFSNNYQSCFCGGSPDCTGSKTSTAMPYNSAVGAIQKQCKNCSSEILYYWSCNPKYSSTTIPDKATAYERDCAGNYGATACSTGYEPVNGKCSPAACSGFNITASSCDCTPQAASCLSGNVTKYKSCTNDLCDPCKNYYNCSGSWQYCTGTTCPDGSKRCSTYCSNDYFPYSCALSSRCTGIYRSGYCSTNSCCNGYNTSCDSNLGYCNDTCKSGSSTYYRYSSCKSGYGLKNHDCLSCGNTAVGHILYADKSTCSFKVDDKTPIAVVVDTGKRIAIALEYLGPSPWSEVNSDIPGLKNYTTFESAISDMDGVSNTQIILSQCGSAKCRAAELAVNYSAGGVSGWYLPSIGELYLAKQNESKIDNALSLLDKSKLNGTPYSSTEINTFTIWLINFSKSSSATIYYTSGKVEQIDDRTYPFIKY